MKGGWGWAGCIEPAPNGEMFVVALAMVYGNTPGDCRAPRRRGAARVSSLRCR